MTSAKTTTENNNNKRASRKKIATYLSQHVQQSSPLPKDNSQRKLQSKLDALLLKLRRREEDDKDDEEQDGKFVVETLTETALTLQEQAEQYSNAINKNSEEEEENRNICEGLHVKACKAYEFAAKWKEEYTVYYNWAIAIGDRARLLESRRPEEAAALWREACEKYEKAVEVGMARSYIGGGRGGETIEGKEGDRLSERVTPMSISRALNNHGLALRQRAMLAAETEESASSSEESKTKFLSEAILKFRRAIRISPDFHRAAYNLGTVEFARGKSEYAAVYVFSALAMVTSSLPSSSETKNAKSVYSQSAQLVETALPDTQCGDDSLFAGNVWFAGGVGKGKERRTTITDFDWARRRFAVCVSAFKTVDSAQTFRIKSESGDYVPSRNDAWGNSASSSKSPPNHFFNVNLPMLSVESCQPISDISRPPNCFAFLLSVREEDSTTEKENASGSSATPPTQTTPPSPAEEEEKIRHYRFACETKAERDLWVDAIALLASLAKRGKSESLRSVLLAVKSKRKKRVAFAE